MSMAMLWWEFVATPCCSRPVAFASVSQIFCFHIYTFLASCCTCTCGAFSLNNICDNHLTSLILMHAAEGDARLVEQSTVANWLIGRLELFFEGSWGQVCAGSFGAADANVACRSMGFGSGTIGPLEINLNNPTRERLVYPEIAVTSLGCTGQEENLLQCPGEMDIRGDDYYPYDSDGCFDDIGRPLVVACVTAAENGVSLTAISCFCRLSLV